MAMPDVSREGPRGFFPWYGIQPLSTGIQPATVDINSDFDVLIDDNRKTCFPFFCT